MAKFSNKKKTEWTWPFPVEEAWNVDYYIAKYALPRIQALIEIEETNSPGTVPGDLSDKYGIEKGHKCWLKYLREMEYAFHLFSTDTFTYETKENKERAKRGLHLFAEYYECLWN